MESKLYINKDEVSKMESEVWKDIEGYENKYQVSNLGNVKSLNYNNTGKEKILLPKRDKPNGILCVKLSIHNKAYDKQVARLVFETFNNIKLSRNDILMYKDKDPENCSLDNLYVITRGKRQELTYDLDKRYRPKYDYYGKELSTKEISKITKIDVRTIRVRIKQLYWNIYEAAEIPKGKVLNKERK